jgi:hypothetical protein
MASFLRKRTADNVQILFVVRHVMGLFEIGDESAGILIVRNAQIQVVAVERWPNGERTVSVEFRRGLRTRMHTPKVSI